MLSVALSLSFSRGGVAAAAASDGGRYPPPRPVEPGLSSPRSSKESEEPSAFRATAVRPALGPSHYTQPCPLPWTNSLLSRKIGRDNVVGQTEEGADRFTHGQPHTRLGDRPPGGVSGRSGHHRQLRWRSQGPCRSACRGVRGGPESCRSQRCPHFRSPSSATAAPGTVSTGADHASGEGSRAARVGCRSRHPAVHNGGVASV